MRIVLTVLLWVSLSVSASDFDDVKRLAEQRFWDVVDRNCFTSLPLPRHRSGLLQRLRYSEISLSRNRHHLAYQYISLQGSKEGRRITLNEVSEETGISRPTLTRISNVPGYNTNTETIGALCDYFEIEPGELLMKV